MFRNVNSFIDCKTHVPLQSQNNLLLIVIQTDNPFYWYKEGRKEEKLKYLYIYILNVSNVLNDLFVSSLPWISLRWLVLHYKAIRVSILCGV